MENKNKRIAFADLTINSTALLRPNPDSWFARAYIDQDVASNYRVIPGVKYQTKVANVNFSPVLVAENCTWNASPSNLSAKTMSVCNFQVQTSICKSDLETSFVTIEMSKGKDGWNNVQNFMNHYWETLGMEIKEEISNLRWNGDPSNGANSGATAYLALCTGFDARLQAATGVIKSAATQVTINNVVALLGMALLAAPATISGRRQSLRYYVASNVATAYRIATAQYNTGLGITAELPFTFNGIEIVEEPSMKVNRIVLTRKDNLVFLFDGEGDGEALKAIDLTETTGEKVIRTQTTMKLGFDILNPTEIVYFY